MVKMTVGDNSGTARSGDTCVVVRQSLAGIAVGEEVQIRFKDELRVTPYRRYRLENADFRDDYDRQRGRIRGTFRRVK